MLTVNGEKFRSGLQRAFWHAVAPTHVYQPPRVRGVVPPGSTKPAIESRSRSRRRNVNLNDALIEYNDPPRIESAKADPNPPVERLTTSTIKVLASDPEGGQLNYDYKGRSGPAGCTVIGHGDTATFNSPNTTGNAVVEVPSPTSAAQPPRRPSPSR